MKERTGGQAMRLIDADRLMDRLRGNVLIDVTTELEKTIADQQTAFDKEKVIDELKEEGCIIDNEAGNRAVEIIEKGGCE